MNTRYTVKVTVVFRGANYAVTVNTHPGTTNQRLSNQEVEGRGGYCRS